MSAALKNSKLPPEQQAIARRLRDERKIEKFSQEELAVDAGIGRASLSHYEYGITALPFAAGIKICRRLDLNQQWLVTGKQPQRPYVPLSDLKLDASIETTYSGTFLDGFRALLAKPMREWVKKHPVKVLIMDQIRSGPDKVFTRMSMLGLEQFIREWSAKLREQDHAQMKSAVLSNIQLAAAELQVRLGNAAMSGVR